MMEKPILETRNISKNFGNVSANCNISIHLNKGEIVAILGENGAGKSTLMNILYGLYRPDNGEILVYGEQANFFSPRDAISLGIGMVHQHFMLVESLTVTQNIILGEEPSGRWGIDYRRAHDEIVVLSKRYHLDVDPDALIRDIPVGLQQRVEILKALYRKAQILILDEPTAVLTPQEVDAFFGIVRKLREQGVSVIIITHKLEEIREISERVYILKKGEIAGEYVTKEVSSTELAKRMIGREFHLKTEEEPHRSYGKTLFEIEDLTVLTNSRLPAVNNLSLQIRSGEIVGIAGVDGNGQEEVAEAIMGLRKAERGDILLDKSKINDWSVRQRIEAGIGYVPADRHGSGLVLPFSVAENILLGNQRKPEFVRYGQLRKTAVVNEATRLIDDFDIVTESPRIAAANLSGGNQQKVILAREFDRKPHFLLICQPTRGLDIGAIEYIHSQLAAMRDQGVGILLISLELDEIFALADRILVLFEGRIVNEFERNEATREEVGYSMTSGAKEVSVET